VGAENLQLVSGGSGPGGLGPVPDQLSPDPLSPDRESEGFCWSLASFFRLNSLQVWTCEAPPPPSAGGPLGNVVHSLVWTGEAPPPPSAGGPLGNVVHSLVSAGPSLPSH